VNQLAIARTPLVHAVPLRSPLVEASDLAWTKFVRVLAVQPLASVSASNCIGLWAHRPRRLIDIGVMRNPRSFRAPSGRMIHAGDFIPPMTDLRFLRSPMAQYDALVKSMVEYAREFEPKGMSLAGMLAILHRAGPPGLSGKLFSDTQALFTRAQDLF
jgi:hypothetical protein